MAGFKYHRPSKDLKIINSLGVSGAFKSVSAVQKSDVDYKQETVPQ